MRNQWSRLGGLLVLAMLSAGAQAAVCTSLSAGNWNSAARWSCGHIPVAADTVVIAHNITAVTTTIAGLTVSAGVTLNDNNRTVTITGDLTNNGTITGGGDMNVTGAASVISGNGTYTNSRLYVSGAAPTIAAGAVLSFTGTSRFYAGRTAGGTTVAGSLLTINGTINSTVTTATTTFLRLYANSTVVGATGVINASVSAVTYNTATATLTNNGSVNVNRITQNAASNSWTQGVNSSLTVAAVSSVGTLNAEANGNTVTYNGTSTVITPSAGYWNLAGSIFPAACPHGVIVQGSDPCPAGGPVSVTRSPGSCVNVTGIGTLAWGTPANAVSSNNAYATVSLNDLQVSNYLRCTSYGFAIPAGATISGITVNVERRASNNGIRDAAMRLVRDAAGVPAIQATDRSTLTTYPTADTSEAHGGAADLWGGAWTPADINSINFGAALASQKPGTAGLSRTVSIDHMPITVTYSTPTMNHVTINAPATAMTLTETPVTIAPHTAAHGALTVASTIDLSTSTGTGDWTIGTGTGTLIVGAPNSGTASYTFGAGESSVTLGFTAQSPGTVTLNVASGGVDMLLNTPAAEKANVIVFTGASFVFTDNACADGLAFGAPGQTCAKVVWSPRVAGQALGNIYITSVNATGVPTRLHPIQNRTRTMQFGLTCHDPIANAGVQATFSATAELLPLCEGNGAAPTVWTVGVVLTFPGGSPSVGPYSFNYGDVGKVELWANRATTSERGSSGAFVVKPAGFTLSNIKRTSDSFANPGAANAAGQAFVRAGEAFTATVTAVNAAGVATPNYGKEVTAESVKLTPALVAGLGLTANPAIGCSDTTNATTCDTTTVPGVEIPKFGAFASGAATGVNFAWDEVGIITLTPSVGDASYLGAGDVTGTASGNVGRFSLGKFALQNVTFDNRADVCQGGFLVADGVTPCAPTFTYLGEQIDANFILVPRSLGGTNVGNYKDTAVAATDFAKLDPSVFADLNLAAADSTTAGGPYYLTGRITTAALPAASCATAPCFQSGSADVTAPFAISRNAATDGPYTAVNIGIAPVDGDGARLEGPGAAPGLCNNPNAADCYDMDSDATAGNDRALLDTIEFRHGRTVVSSAYGSELLGLVLPLAIEYWNGSAYVRSANDSETVVAVTLGNYRRNLNAGETTATVSSVANGVGRISMTPPGANNNGSVDVSATAPAYLPGNNGRATFGVYKGPFIYLREQY